MIVVVCVFTLRRSACVIVVVCLYFDHELAKVSKKSAEPLPNASLALYLSSRISSSISASSSSSLKLSDKEIGVERTSCDCDLRASKI